MLRIDGLTKKYKSFDLDVTFTVESGRITGLVGANGAGKSTTLKAILNLIKMDTGRIQLNDMILEDSNTVAKEQIGSVLSDSFFSETFNMKRIGKVLKASYKSFDSAFYEAKCKALNLPFDKPIGSFSSGMLAKAKIVAALSHDAKLLILDEPTAGLDVVAREEIHEMLQEYMDKDEERSIIISSHISSDIEKICDDLYMIDNGRIVFHEETDVLLSEYAVVKVDEEQFLRMDKQYIYKYTKDKFGYSCLTNQKMFYVENYPGYAVEKLSIDEMMIIMIKGAKV